MVIDFFNYLFMFFGLGVYAYGFYYGVKYKMGSYYEIYLIALYIGLWKAPYKWTLVVLAMYTIYYNFFDESLVKT